MVESEAYELNEEIMLGAVLYGHEMMKNVIQGIKEFAVEVNKPKWNWVAPEPLHQLVEQIKMLASEGIKEAYLIKDKGQRHLKLAQLRQEVLEALTKEEINIDQNKVLSILIQLKKIRYDNVFLQGNLVLMVAIR